MYTQLVSSVLFPLHELAKGHGTFRIRRALERSQWWSAEQLEIYQVVTAAIASDSSGEEGALLRPPLRGAAVRPRRARLPPRSGAASLSHEGASFGRTSKISKPKARGVSLFNTGGSTGEPLQFFIGKERVTHDVAAKWRATRWWGVDIGDREIVVWGSPIELGAQDRVRELRDRVLRTAAPSGVRDVGKASRRVSGPHLRDEAEDDLRIPVGAFALAGHAASARPRLADARE